LVREVIYLFYLCPDLSLARGRETPNKAILVWPKVAGEVEGLKNCPSGSR
jgi:hypothetical protein